MPESNDNWVIETVNLTKVFHDFWHRPKVKAVDQLNLQVRRGEVFGLLGPNGSGKSTTIKLLLGLLFPSRGIIRLLGRSPREVAVKSRIGFLPEETYLYPYLNARETLDFFARLNRIPRNERLRRVRALIDMVGLASARNRPLREYSKGMARRIGIAQALINDPELILLDEPTTGLDPIGTREVKDLIIELKNRGKSILLCSHLLADVEDVCDRIAILYGGRLLAQGDVEGLLAKRQLTQFTVPGLTDAEADRLTDLLQQNAGDKAVEVGHPLDRLESFFLRVIEEARAAQPESSGAGAGRFDETLFGHEPEAPERVIERLTAQPAEPEPEPAEPEPADEQPAQHVLDRLTAIEPEPEAEAPPAEPEPEPDDEARRSVLDRLVAAADDEEDEGDAP
jgi:ABC-2 type transport system ATP-binding protein